MYVPSIDSYTVSVNNIFQEHFNLRQNNFRADLNGFKQFEVTFVFDEIRRNIEFTPPEITETPSEMRRLGRTNLSGLVRDASSLQPVRAEVEVVDTKTGTTVASTVSDRSTGRYSTSFSTGERYVLIVTANGYWMNSQRLILDQFLTIQDVERDVLLERITLGARFQLNNLQFDMRSSEIPTEALPELDRLIEQLKQNPNVRIRIEGHADPLEHLENNQLSQQRAMAVRNYMIENGFSNIEVVGLGDSQPLAPNNNENNRSRNRRVEIIIIDR
jgi:outer membrane protein OmpA-like peptidoglycan-associated protein